jgi:hypothetical protein
VRRDKLHSMLLGVDVPTSFLIVCALLLMIEGWCKRTLSRYSDVLFIPVVPLFNVISLSNLLSVSVFDSISNSLRPKAYDSSDVRDASTIYCLTGS